MLVGVTMWRALALLMAATNLSQHEHTPHAGWQPPIRRQPNCVSFLPTHLPAGGPPPAGAPAPPVQWPGSASARPAQHRSCTGGPHLQGPEGQRMEQNMPGANSTSTASISGTGVHSAHPGPALPICPLLLCLPPICCQPSSMMRRRAGVPPCASARSPSCRPRGFTPANRVQVCMCASWTSLAIVGDSR